MHVICPLEFERSRLVRAANARGWILHCSGPGDAGIERWAASVRFPTGTRVVLAGVAGGLRPAAIPGTAVVPSIIVDEHGRMWHPPVRTGRADDGAPPQPAVRCLAAQHVIRTPDAKRVAAERFDADLVDMESAAFARVAEAAGWNWLVIRGISDGYNDTLPDGVEQWTSANGRTRIGAVLGSLARRPMRLPTLVPQLLALGRRSGAAMQAVEDALTERHSSQLRAPRGGIGFNARFPMNDQTTEHVDAPAITNAERPIVIFGGTFDPPHRRHVEIAQGVDALLKAKQMLVIPAWQNPQREAGPVASSADRLAMCSLAFDTMADTVVLPIEISRAAPSFTIDTVRAVHEMQAAGSIMKGPLRLVVGSDQAINFRSWKDWADLTSLATPVVVLRPPHTRADWPALLAEQMDEAWAARWLSWTLPIEPVNSSSTEVRRRIAAGESTEDLLLPAVANYIQSSGLYAPAR